MSGFISSIALQQQVAKPLVRLGLPSEEAVIPKATQFAHKTQGNGMTGNRHAGSGIESGTVEAAPWRTPKGSFAGILPHATPKAGAQRPPTRESYYYI